VLRSCARLRAASSCSAAVRMRPSQADK
jgi:hypothetical protein